MDGFDEPYWGLRQLTVWLTRAPEDGITWHPTEGDALRAVRRRVLEGRLQAWGRRCSWQGGRIVSRGDREAAPLLEVVDLVFISAPHGSEYFAAPSGSKPFAVAEPIRSDVSRLAGLTYVDADYDERLSKPIEFEGWCELLFKRDEVLVQWPARPEHASSNETKIAGEIACGKWLVELMRNGKPEKPKAEYRADAIKRFTIGVRGFHRAWTNAIKESGNTAWSLPGSKKSLRDSNRP